MGKSFTRNELCVSDGRRPQREKKAAACSGSVLAVGSRTAVAANAGIAVPVEL